MRQSHLKTKYIRRRRKELALTQQQAAVAAGFSSAGVWGMYEMGKFVDPKISSLKAMAAVLKCGIVDLVEGK